MSEDIQTSSSAAEDKPLGPPPGDGGLQFEQVEHAEEAAPGLCCFSCKQVLAADADYWQVNGLPACAVCCAQLQQQHSVAPLPWRTWGRVLVRGGGAALIGTLLYWGVSYLTGYEIGLIAILVGLLVGGAVQRASGSRGGWKLQAVAMALTYASIVSSYMPTVYKALMKSHADNKAAVSAPAGAATPSSAAPPSSVQSAEKPPAERGSLLEIFGGALKAIVVLLALLFALSAAAPILAGFENIIGWFIIAIALYEAWKMNRRAVLRIQGPLRLQPDPLAAAAPPV